MDQIAVSHDGAVTVAGDAVFKAAGVDHGVDVSGEVVGKDVVLHLFSFFGEADAGKNIKYFVATLSLCEKRSGHIRR